ncbi:MAG TPA: winged helix-turn-helix domain-containing protein [Terriglobia bacterium]|nr:winged helix-turn-helix domain-containing protein [Terriglobia bacterium]
MKTDPAPGTRVRFGIFEADLSSGELRRDGLKVKIQEMPFQVLVSLLERPGEVVTREDLRKRLWPADTFVDFEHGLSKAINKLREALGDDANNPRFVETLTRRGYRFIGPVERTDHNNSSSGKDDSPQVHPWAASPRWWVMMAAVAALAGLLAGVFWLSRPSPRPQVTGMVQLTHDGQAKSGPLLSDGSRIYFGEGNYPSFERTQVSVHGGEVAPAAAISIPQPVPLDISPDGSEFLLTQVTTTAFGAPLWIAPVLAGSPRRVGNLMVNLDVPTQTAAWSPDMQRIAFAREDDLYTVSPDGTYAKKLVSLPGHGFAVHWSPDGLHLVMTVQDTKTYTNSLWELRADGTNLHQLLPGWNNPPAECCGVWTPDGKYLVFQATRNAVTSLWALPQKTGPFRRAAHQPVQLTTGPMDMLSPVLSRDGSKIFTVGIQRRGKLARYDAQSKNFVPYLGGASIEDVDFSKNGKWIAYTSLPGGCLWRSKADGSSKLQLTFPPLQVLLPRWSPDGKQIAFVGLKPGESTKVYVVPADGGEPERVLPPDTAEEHDPAWSPDGNRLAISKNPSVEVRSPQEREIEIVDLKTRQVATVAGSEDLYSPRWSPDGRYLVAMPHDSTRLTLFDFKSQKWQELVKMAIGCPSWSRDNKYIYFNDLNNTGFYRVRVSDRKVEQVASLARINVETPWTGLAPDDSPMIVLDTSIDEIYAVDWTAP